MSDLIERLEAWIPGCGAEAPMSMEADLRQAVKALEAADGLSEAVSKFSILSGMFDPEKSRAAYANDFYRSARSTSTKEDG